MSRLTEYGDSIVLIVFTIMFSYNVVIVTPDFDITFNVISEDAGRTLYLRLVDEHYSATIPRKSNINF